jgi:hypothetical protein
MLDLCNCQLGPAAAAALADVLLPAAAGPRNPLTMLHLDRAFVGIEVLGIFFVGRHDLTPSRNGYNVINRHII